MTTKRAPMPPDQYNSYAMGRFLILLNEWHRIVGKDIDENRAALFDFILRQPREVSAVVPGLNNLLEANDFDKGDLSDLFAKQQLATSHEEFNAILSGLVARGLVKISSKDKSDPCFHIELTPSGTEIAGKFASRMGFFYREIAELIVAEFSKRDPSKIFLKLRSAIPDQSLAVSWLTKPFEVGVMAKKQLKVKKIKITSASGDYDVELFDGLNIISGPHFTGKTSILKLIDYCCGAKNPIDYPEIKHCSDVMVEFVIDDEPLTISRSLRAASADALYFDSTIDEIRSNKIKGTSISFRQVKGQDSISSIILRRLGLWNIPIKTAPTKDSSRANTFSIRELMRIMYFDQSRMSSEEAFYESNFTKKFGYQAAFEIVNEIHDDDSARASREINEVEEEMKSLESDLRATRKFLDSFNVPHLEELEKLKRAANEEIENQTKKIEDFKERSNSLLGKRSELVDQKENLENQIEVFAAKIESKTRTLKNLSRLKTQYDREMTQLQFLSESDKLIGQLPIIRCPGCLQEIPSMEGHESCYVCMKPLPLKDEDISIDTRMKSLKRRSGDLEKFLREMDEEVTEERNKKENFENKLHVLIQEIDRLLKDYRVPFAREAAELERTLAEKKHDLARIDEQMAFRLKAQGEGSRLPKLKDKLENLRKHLESVKSKSISRDEVISDLSMRLSSLLQEFEFVSAEGARIDADSYVPIIRGQSYNKLSSLGAIGLVLSSTALAILERAIEIDTSFPMFLMLDSPLNQLGKDKSKDPFRDQRAINGFYKHVLNLHNKFGSSFQLIIVDNMPPDFVQSRVTVRFSGENTGRYGLISEITAEDSHFDTTPES